MNYKLRWKTTAAAIAAALTLAACGGGGGGDSSSSTPTPPTSGNTPTNPAPSTPLPADPGASIPAPGLTNVIARDGLAWINYRRTQIGMPVVAAQTQINTAATKHSEYLATNRLMSHEQVSTRQGFTGATVGDRLNAAGYTLPTGEKAYYGYGEVISGSTNNSGFFMVDELITAIYHRFVIFEPMFREIGTGAATSGSYNYFTADFAFRDAVGQGIAKGSIVTWPYNNQTLVTTTFKSDTEDPDPIPDRGDVGYPISVHTNLTSKLEVISFTVRPKGGSNLEVRRIDPLSYQQEKDPTKKILTATSIVPLEPLKAATTYDVFFIGMVDGAAVTREWSFTTQ